MIIHLIAPKDKTQWPNIWHHCYNIWKSSPHEIRMWHDEDIDQLLKEDDEEFYTILNTLPTIFKFDYVRYVILEKFGGAYFDMDVEVVDGSFLNKLHPGKVYLMEGTSGTYVENSIMITPPSLLHSEYWKRLKISSKYNIKSDLTKDFNRMDVVWLMGAGLLSKFFIDFHLNTPPDFPKQWDILGYHQFGSKSNTLAYTYHHQTNFWN